MQYHYVVVYDSKLMKWWVESDSTFCFRDGNVWDDEQNDWNIPGKDIPGKSFDMDLFSTLESCIAELSLNHRLNAALAAAWQSVIDATDLDETSKED